MKLGFLGTGMIVKDLMRTADRIPLEKKYLLGTEATREETEQMAHDNGFDGTFYDYDALLESDVDTIYVALPNFLHYSFAKKALEAGKHVIIEKPVTTNYREFCELKEIALAKNLFMFEAMSIHYMPAFEELRKQVQKLGDLKIISVNYSQYSRRYDAFKEGNILPVFDPKKAGGALMDLNVYNLHMIAGLFGKPQSVTYLANVERGIDTSGIVLLDYGTFKVSSIAAKDCKAPIVSSIQGDQAAVTINGPVNGLRGFSVNHNSGDNEEYSFDKDTHRLLYEFLAFVKAVDEKDYALRDRMLEVSGTVSEIMTQARMSAGIVFPADNQ